MKKSLPLDSANTILDCLEHYAKIRPTARAYTFLANGVDQEKVLTYGELRSRALNYAQLLRDHGFSRKVALLLFPSGLDFIIAFFACAYSGTIAVPANLARNSHHYTRLKQIILDSETCTVLTTPDLRNSINEGLTRSGIDTSCITVNCESNTLVANAIVILPDPEQLAFLQYTSGSTGQSKGVMVSHMQLIANERAIQNTEEFPEYLIVGGWLPQFHDMGLIGATLQPIALGGHYVFMSPLHFLQRPLRWLEMLSNYHAIATAAPNFALELCVKAPFDEIKTSALNLSSIKAIFCGAEPVIASTVARFEERFAHLGLQKNTVKPCFGLAEATLIVSGGTVPDSLRTLMVCRDALANGRIEMPSNAAQPTQPIVCCGRTVKDHCTVIVDPHTGHILEDNQIGEVWFTGTSVASGYWRNPSATIATFKALTSCGAGPFMRTGDLGFLRDGGLFITGRIKELIIVRGRNLYPHDIEFTLIEVSAPFIKGVQAVVFSNELNGEQEIVAYVELPRRAKVDCATEFQKMVHAFQQAVTQVHNAPLRDIYFLSYGSIPLTTSGKKQRKRCAEMYASREIDYSTQTLFSTRLLESQQLKTSIP